MLIQENAPLAPLTSFGVGGPAEKLATVESEADIVRALEDLTGGPLWYLGYGTNVLISDSGLPGTTLLFRNRLIEWQNDLAIVGAGLWWDDLVQAAIARGLWGLELTSGIPGSVGAAVFINITAYGQSQSDCLEWVDYIDPAEGKTARLKPTELDWGYKESLFQFHPDWLITQAAYRFQPKDTTPLTYQSALDAASELGLSAETLSDRRQIIMEARRRAGSLFIPGQGYSKTVGSFFRNPLVTAEQADLVMGFDETGKSKQQIMAMNRVHGGSDRRISAAHALLAAGFRRGQRWGDVRLHPANLLKIENTGGASAQDIYDVAQEIISTVKQRLEIELEAEARILGEFNSAGENGG